MNLGTVPCLSTEALGKDQVEPGARVPVGAGRPAERRVQVRSLPSHAHVVCPHSCLLVRIRTVIHDLLKTVEETTLI